VSQAVQEHQRYMNPSPPILPNLQQAPERQDILDTLSALRPFVRHTPVLRSSSLDHELGMQLFFKAENLQRVGAFKMRGAMRAALALSPAQRAKGLLTHSSGNHAQAIAKAALVLGCPAHIVMPENAPSVKRDAVLGYGAKVYSCAPTFEARLEGMERVRDETGAHYIPPFDDYNVIAGQATAAWELMDAHPDLDLIVVPIGGGGLGAGTCLSARYHDAGPIPVVGTEPERVDDAFRSLRSGIRQGNDRIDTIADGLRTPLGDRNFAILQEALQDIWTVAEEAILPAASMLMQRLNCIVEPSAAVPFAALQQHKQQWEGKSVGIVLSGGNTDRLVWQ
jgi:threonine dehydratase